MRTFFYAISSCGVVLAAASSLVAQPPGQGRGNTARATTADLVAQLMAFDQNKDDKLTKNEVTDERLHRLFDRADTDKDGTVTRGELNALQVRERANTRGRSGGFGGPGGGPGGFGGPGGGGRGGFGGPGGGPPQPGQILPGMVRQRLSLTADQEKQVNALQKEVDAKLDKILTAEQKQQLRQMRDRGPGGFGPGGPPPGGRGPGGFGPPPDGDGPPPNGDGPPPGGGRRPRGEAPPPPPDEAL